MPSNRFAIDTVERFSNRVENYVKYRPGYPSGVVKLFKDEMGLTDSSVIADIGSGTGLFTKLLLENGNRVIGVEPNEAMRSAAAKFLYGFARFQSIDGTAEATGLDDDSVDFAVSAQAFHWFDQTRARQEFERILKPGGYAVLIWNQRLTDRTPFLAEYEQFLLKNANDYSLVRHENVNEEALNTFFGKAFSERVFDNVQVFDFDGLKGRMLSSSYMPAETDERFPEIVDELRSLFAKHNQNGKIEVFYNTRVFYTEL